MQPASSRKIPSQRTPADEYRAKAVAESSRVSRNLKKRGQQPPLGDPSSGIMLVVEPPAGPRVLDALSRSLEALDLADAYVTFSSGEFFMQELLIVQPSVLAAVGPGAGEAVDRLGYSLAQDPFAGASEGEWFAWTKGTAGILLPSLAPALRDEQAKKRFWRAFLALKAITDP